MEYVNTYVSIAIRVNRPADLDRNMSDQALKTPNFIHEHDTHFSV